MVDILKEINQKSSNEDILISNHAKVRMIDRGISTLFIKSLINSGEIIEQYSDDYPCPSVLLLSMLNDIPFHIVIGNCEDHIRIITIYQPDEEEWMDHRKRRGGNN